MPLRSRPSGAPEPSRGTRQPAQAEPAHRTALTQLRLEGRRAHHHVRPPLLHSRRAPLPQPGDSAVASPGGRLRSSCHAARGLAGPGSGCRKPRGVPAGLHGRHGLATPRRVGKKQSAGQEAAFQHDGCAQARAVPAQASGPACGGRGPAVPPFRGRGSSSPPFWPPADLGVRLNLGLSRPFLSRVKIKYWCLWRAAGVRTRTEPFTLLHTRALRSFPGQMATGGLPQGRALESLG